ncbi:MAG: hypothetical protein WC289_05425 [Patescibacteria group bacterium]|jgi:hypothetical protein
MNTYTRRSAYNAPLIFEVVFGVLLSIAGAMVVSLIFQNFFDVGLKALIIAHASYLAIVPAVCTGMFYLLFAKKSIGWFLSSYYGATVVIFLFGLIDFFSLSWGIT